MKPQIKQCELAKEYYFDEGCFITELSNSEADAEVSIARARVLSGETTKWHYLQKTTERYVILEGTGRVEIGELAPQEVTTGDTVIIPADVRQRISNVGDSNLIFLAICSPRFTAANYVEME